MSNIELAVKASKELEGILEQKFNAQGRGLHEKATSVQHLLPASLIQQLRFIAAVRNQTVHESDYEMDAQTRQRFTTAYEEAKNWLNEHQGSGFSANNRKIEPMSFSIPEDLKTFSTGINGSRKVVLATITGEVAEQQERTVNGNVLRKVWMKLNDGKESYFEFTNFDFLGRRGHIITIFMENRKSNLLAVYNHQIDRVFYLEENIKLILNKRNLVDSLVGIGASIGALFIISLLGQLLYMFGDVGVILNALVLILSLIIIIVIIKTKQKQQIKALKQHIIKIISNCL